MVAQNGIFEKPDKNRINNLIIARSTIDSNSCISSEE